MWATLTVSTIPSVTTPFLSSSTALSLLVLIIAIPFSMVSLIKSLHKLQLVQKLMSLPGLPHSTTASPSFCNSTGSRSNSEQNWKSYCIDLRPSLTFSLLICLIFSISPPHPAASAPLPSSTLLCVLPASEPWTELSAALSTTLEHQTYENISSLPLFQLKTQYSL